MNPKIKVLVEGRRGCGHRKEGALYLMGEGEARPCDRLPIALELCPVCGGGVRPARLWVWMDGDGITEQARRSACREEHCGTCPLGKPEFLFGKSGLLWVGEKFYRTPEDFMKEAVESGISRRINFIPHGFKLGETWVFLAHRKVSFREGKGERGRSATSQGIFHLFRPARIEVVVKGDESDTLIQSYIDRGLTPVQIIKRDGRIAPTAADDDIL